MRANHAAWLERLAWVAVAVSAGVLVVVSFLPAFELATKAQLGRSATEFDYVREVAFAVHLRPLGLVPLAAGLLLVTAAAFALLRPPPWWLATGSLVVALGVAWVVIDTDDRLRASDVIGYAEHGAGPLLQPALDELEAEARRSPEARDPRWTLLGSEDDYDFSRRLVGWQILAVTTQALVWLTGYRELRRALAPLPALAVVVGATLVFWAWWFLHALQKTA